MPVLTLLLTLVLAPGLLGHGNLAFGKVPSRQGLLKSAYARPAESDACAQTAADLGPGLLVGHGNLARCQAAKAF